MRTDGKVLTSARMIHFAFHRSTHFFLTPHRAGSTALPLPSSSLSSSYASNPHSQWNAGKVETPGQPTRLWNIWCFIKRSGGLSSLGQGSVQSGVGASRQHTWKPNKYTPLCPSPHLGDKASSKRQHNAQQRQRVTGCRPLPRKPTSHQRPIPPLLFIEGGLAQFVEPTGRGEAEPWKGGCAHPLFTAAPCDKSILFSTNLVSRPGGQLM